MAVGDNERDNSIILLYINSCQCYAVRSTYFLHRPTPLRNLLPESSKQAYAWSHVANLWNLKECGLRRAAVNNKTP